MDIIYNFLLDHAFELLTSAGLIGLYMAKENRRTVKIDNDRKVMEDLVAHLDRMKKELEAMEAKYAAMEERNAKILKAKDERIKELEDKVAALEKELGDMKARRNAKGQFCKRGSAMVSEAEAGK